jgi:hypothetical protein
VLAYSYRKEIPRHGLLLSGEEDDSFASKASEPKKEPYFRGDNFSRSNAIPNGRGTDTDQSDSSLAISHTISIPFGMAFWD